MNALHKRIIDISYEQGLSHIGSCLTALPILERIYQAKLPTEKIVLDSGHAHLAHLVVREKYEGKKIGKIHDIHCNKKDGCDVPTGSLGQGLPIAVGLALADRTKNVYCLVTDGGMAEGSNWEALRISDQLNLTNLIIYCLANGYGAYGKVNANLLAARMNLFNPAVIFEYIDLPKWDFMPDPQEYHYKALNKEEYEKITR